ncbi:MAG: hypothetical protein IJ106_14010 [Parasporobacterium sp.]|nr:hypothetical protein [Parasporobacterium sp.]
MKLRRILRKYIINNIGYKILAVVFSFLLWVVILNITDPEYTRTISNIPVQIVNENLVLDGNHVYTISSGEMTNIIVTGKRSIISTLTPNDFRVYADFEELSITNAVPIKVELRGTKSRYSNQISMTTRDTTMIINLEEMSSKQIPVEIEYRGEPVSYLVIEEANLTPKKVTVYAPQSVIDAAEKAVVTVDYVTVGEDAQLSVQPTLRDADGNPVKDSPNTSLDEPEILIDFKISYTNQVPIEIGTSGDPAQGYELTGLELSQDVITVKGSWVDVSSMGVLELPDTLLDITGAQEDISREIDVTEFLPENVVVYGESPMITATAKIQQIQ